MSNRVLVGIRKMKLDATVPTFAAVPTKRVVGHLQCPYMGVAPC